MRATDRDTALARWLDTVGPLTARSSRLVLALCAAFAAPLFAMTKARPFLAHLYGPQADGEDPWGRQAVIRMPASVYGSTAFETSYWRLLDRNPATVHDETEDGLLLLSNFDETPHGEVIQVAGTSWFEHVRAPARLDLRRDRVTLSCGALPIDPWLLRLANGGAGKVWLVNVPTDALTGNGMFEIAVSPAERAMLDVTADNCAGWVGLRWLEHLNREGRPLVDKWQDEIGSGDVRLLDPATRLTCFELVTIFARLTNAGEEATRAGLTGWSPGTAKAAVWKCFVDMVQADSRRAGRRPDAPGTLSLHLVTRDQLSGGVDRDA